MVTFKANQTLVCIYIWLLVQHKLLAQQNDVAACYHAAHIILMDPQAQTSLYTPDSRAADLAACTQ